MSVEQKKEPSATSKMQSGPSNPTRGDILKALALLAESRGVEITQARLEIYLEDLSDLPGERVLEAIHKWRRDGSQYFPQIPELRRTVLPEMNSEAEAERAWTWALTYISAGFFSPEQGHRGFHGAEQPPVIPARVEYAVRGCGGWERLWNNAEGSDELGFIRREFIAAWNAAPPEMQTGGQLSDGQILKQIPGVNKLLKPM